MVEKSTHGSFGEDGEPVEPAVDPYLEIEGNLVPVTLLSIDEARKLIANKDPRQLLLVLDGRDNGDGERLACFSDLNFRLKAGQGFKGIIWRERKAIPSST